MANILVTGSMGFIGKNLSNLLKKRGFTVKGLDLKGNHSEKSVDITNIDWAEYNLEYYDAVIHLAAKVSVAESFMIPDIYEDVNVKATEKLFKMCAKLKVKNVIFASSAAVYGDSVKEIKVVGEEGNPESPYAGNKLEGEIIAKKFASPNTKFTCFRFFNVYGQGQSSDSEYSSVIPLFIDRLKSGKEIIIFGKGQQTRDFIHVNDICNIIVSCINNDSIPKFSCINLGTGNGASILDLANNLFKIADELNFSTDSKIIFKPERPGDVMHSTADIIPLSRIYDVNSLISLDTGLKNLLFSSPNGVSDG